MDCWREGWKCMPKQCLRDTVHHPRAQERDVRISRSYPEDRELDKPVTHGENDPNRLARAVDIFEMRDGEFAARFELMGPAYVGIVERRSL
jgi:hypothetical protein